MSNTIEAGTIVGGPVNNDTVNMAQVQTSRKGKIAYWGVDKTGDLCHCLVMYSLFLILHIAKNSK